MNHENVNKTFRFGQDVAGYNIPVLNEREIRAAAGLLFLNYVSLDTAGNSKGEFYNF